MGNVKRTEGKLSKGIALLLLLLWQAPLSAQTCVADYFFLSYKGEHSQKVNRTLRTPQNELLSIGSVYYSKNNMFFYDGWITKMTAQGGIIWSKRYNIPRHNVVSFQDVISASDSTYFVTGTVSHLGPIDTTRYSKDIWGILLHIDKQGKLLWSRELSARFNPLIERTNLQSISKTKEGDFILSAVVRSNISVFNQSLLIIRINAKGKVKWTSALSSPAFVFDFGLTKSLQLNNSNILVAGLTDQRNNQGNEFLKVGYHILRLDYATGSALWNKVYLFINKPGSTYFATYESLEHISELPDGSLSFQAFITDSSGLSIPPNTSKSVNIITNPTGQLQNAVSYSNARFSTYPAAVQTLGNGEQIVLIDDGEKAPLLHIDAQGQIKKQNGYTTGSSLIPVSLLNTNNGNNIF